MNIRESMEQRELELLSPYAAIRETGTEFCTVRHFGE